MDDFTLILFSTSIFLAIAAVAFVLLTTYASRLQLRQRLRLEGAAVFAGQAQASGRLSQFAGLNERLLGTKPTRSTKLRADLQKAGYFSEDAPGVFLLMRTAAMVLLPLVGFAVVQGLDPEGTLSKALLVALILLLVGYSLPGAMLERLKARQVNLYRQVFPDLLDMLVVCVDAGLSFEGALQRIAADFGVRSRPMTINLMLLNSELRSGRSTGEALDAFADRLGLDEARSFSTLLKQSLELGSDIGSALRVYCEEMRNKRSMRAEERANRLPVIMTIPLAIFIFPVIIIVIMYPAFMKIAETLQSFMGG